MTNPVTPIGTALTHMLVVKAIEPARDFYTSVLGATVYREYGGTSCVLLLHDSWLLLVTGGGPTDDKPSVSFAEPAEPDRVSHAMTIRVDDCQAAYAETFFPQRSPPNAAHQAFASLPIASSGRSKTCSARRSSDPPTRGTCRTTRRSGRSSAA